MLNRQDSLPWLPNRAGDGSSVSTIEPDACRFSEFDPESLLNELTLDEKLGLLSGGFRSGGLPRFGIPPLISSDGPVGIRLMAGENIKGGDEVEDGAIQEEVKTTAFPSTLALAATFDVEAARRYGQLIGEEAHSLGIHLMFGPGVNLMRDPRGGRNFEYMGEDPLLTGLIAVHYIRGMQDQGVGATAKHFFANDADDLRHFTSSNLDERTAWELHLLPFELAVREGACWAIMTGNNLVNGVHITQNRSELEENLRARIGFEGVVLTDWRAAYTPLESVQGGADMTTGFCSYVYGDGDLKKLITDGTLAESQIDVMAGRVLELYEKAGLLNTTPQSRQPFNVGEHAKAARALAAQGMVLIKNEGNLLPLGPRPGLKLLITGPAANEIHSGAGSGYVEADSVTPVVGLRAAYPQATLTHLSDPDQALCQAAGMDAVIYFANTEQSGEGSDMEAITLIQGQDQEINSLGAANPNLVVVVQNSSALEMASWVNAPRSILIAWFGGESGGEAIADILTGRVNPSGKLPCTFGKTIADYPAEALKLWPARLVLPEHPGDPGHTKQTRRAVYGFAADYKEALFMGYRWFDQEKIEPLFPFGFGLSYTSFDLAALDVTEAEDGTEVRCTVTNTGTRAGAQVIQVYVCPPCSPVARPPRELKGFARVELKPGESRMVTIRMRRSAFAYYEVNGRNWRIEPGTYRIEVGVSSRELPLKAELQISKARTLERF